MAQKKLLVAGGGHADIPLIQAAQSLGYFVITSGNRAPDRGHPYADQYCPADFSDPQAMLELARTLNIDAICSSCNDFSAISCAYVAEQLNLPGHDDYETSKIIHHKDAYRDFAHQHGIPAPKAQGFSDVDTAISAITTDFSLPVIVKPVDLTGGKGVMKIEHMSNIENAVQEAFSISKSKRVVVEEFIVGTNHGFTSIIRDGKVVFNFTDNEYYYLNKYMVSGASSPGLIPDHAVENLIKQTENISQILNLVDGIFHIQFILQNDQPVIIEICRRAPGDLYIEFVKLATGIDYPLWITKAFVGGDLSDLKQNDSQKFFTRHCIMGDKKGTLRELFFDPQIADNVVDSFIWGKPGDLIEDPLIQKHGIVFLSFSSQDEMLAQSAQLQSLIVPVVE